MKEYKFIHINPGLHLNRDKDLNIAESELNKYIKEGWELQQLISPNDLGGAIIAVMYKEV